MPYVLRDADGSILAVARQQPDDGGDWQPVDAQAADYLRYLEETMAQADRFRESDIHLARVLEDLIDVLIERDVIRFTDLPEAARKRLLSRQALRRQARLVDILDERQGGLL